MNGTLTSSIPSVHEYPVLSNNTVTTGPEHTRFLGRKTETKAQISKKNAFFPPHFSGTRYRQGIQDSNTDLLVRNIIQCQKLSDLPSVIGDKAPNQLATCISKKKRRYEQALAKLQEYDNIFDKPVAGAIVTTVKNRARQNKSSGHPVPVKKRMHNSYQSFHQDTVQVKKRRTPNERIIEWPKTIDKLVEDIQEKMNRLRDTKEGCAKDIEPCWYELTSGKYGDAVKDLIMTVVVDGTPSRAQINRLQKKIVDAQLIELATDEQYAEISEQQTVDLQNYLKSRIFNGKMVSFSFDDFKKFLQKTNEQKKSFCTPKKLLWLGDEIRGEINRAHFKKGITLNWNECWKSITESRFKKPIIDLMYAISLPDTFRLPKLQKLQKGLNKVLEEKYPFLSSSLSGKDNDITEEQADNLYRYLRTICFDIQLVNIDFYALQKYLASWDARESEEMALDDF